MKFLRNCYFCPFGKVFLEKLCRATADRFHKGYAMMKIGIKYCGGCNPKFDRMAFVRRLKEAFGHCEVQAVSSDDVFDCVAVVCGCPVACASLRDINTRKGFVIVRKDDMEATIKHLLTLQCDETESEGKRYV